MACHCEQISAYPEERQHVAYFFIGVQKLSMMLPELCQVSQSSQWHVTLERFSTQHYYKSFSVTLPLVSIFGVYF